MAKTTLKCCSFTPKCLRTSTSQRAAKAPVVPTSMSVKVPARSVAVKRFESRPTTQPITIAIQEFTSGPATMNGKCPVASLDFNRHRAVGERT